MLYPFKDFPFQLKYMKEPKTYDIKFSELNAYDYGVIVEDIIYNIDAKIITICYYNNSNTLYGETLVTFKRSNDNPFVPINYGPQNMASFRPHKDYGIPTSIESIIYFTGYRPLKWIFNILPE